MELIIKNGKLLKYFPPRESDALVLPDGVNAIGDHAFSGADVVRVVLRREVTSIGLGAFDGCTELESIELPESLGYIGREAFRGCVKLTGVTIPKKTERLNNDCFFGCGSLTSVSLHEKLIFGTNVFDCCGSIARVDIGSVSIRSFALGTDTSSIERLARAVRYGTIPDRIHGALSAQLAAELFLRFGNEQAKIFLRRNAVKSFKYLMCDGRTDLLIGLAAEKEIVSRDLDALIEAAISTEQHEVYIMLTGLRHGTQPESSMTDRFAL